jgi:hypothetical protein
MCIVLVMTTLLLQKERIQTTPWALTKHMTYVSTNHAALIAIAAPAKCAEALEENCIGAQLNQKDVKADAGLTVS